MEFLVDKKGNFYFMEMNTRLQVEHPVTEEVSGIDIVRAQILVASGEKLNYSQRRLKFRGAAIECRINAEDPANSFRPTPGRITEFVPPGGRNVRLDSHAYAGYEVPPFYDSMVAKLVVTGADRRDALSILRRALREFKVEGIKTTIPFFRDLIEHNLYASGQYDTTFVDEFVGG